jgi:hypothetical protein
MSKHAISQGVIGGLILVAINLLIYVIDPMLMANWWLTLVFIPLIFVVLLVIGLNIRKAEGGYLKFGKAFLSVFIAALIMSLLSTIWNIVLFNVVDPGLAEALMETMADKMLAMMERLGAPVEDIEGEMQKGFEEAAAQFQISGQILGFFTGAFWWALGALIVGAIVKKNPPVDTLDAQAV